MTIERRIDLNADLGEGFSHDERLLEIVTSANVCAGAYAGSAALTTRTIAMAAIRGVRIGAHVGYPDRASFGRNPMELSKASLSETLREQLETCERAAEAAGARVVYLKPHGALYHALDADGPAVGVVLELATSDGLCLLHRRGSALWNAGRARGVVVHAEGFADRRYRADGRLVSRGVAGSLLETDTEVAAQATRLARLRGDRRVDSLCIHGDHEGAYRNARAVRAALLDAGIEPQAPRS